MTVDDLQTELAKLDAQLGVMVAVNGTFVPVVGVTAASGSSFALVRGKGKMQKSNRFTIDDEGILGHLTRLGLSDDEIAEVLGGSAKSVKQRKALRLTPPAPSP